MQPADVAAFKPLKTGWKKAVLEFRRKNPHEMLTKEKFATVLKGVIEDYAKAETIKNGFKASGLYPWNASGIDFTKCLGTKRETKIYSDTNVEKEGSPNISFISFNQFKEIVGEERIAIFKKIDQFDEASHDEFILLYKLYKEFEKSNSHLNAEIRDDSENLEISRAVDTEIENMEIIFDENILFGLDVNGEEKSNQHLSSDNHFEETVETAEGLQKNVAQEEHVEELLIQENKKKETQPLPETMETNDILEENVPNTGKISDYVLKHYFFADYTSNQSLYTERGKGPILFGLPPPEKVSLEDLCGPPVQCPDCDSKELKCSAGVSLVDLITHWEVRPYHENITYSGFPSRVKDCILYAVGKPVYLRESNDMYGCFMRDSNPLTEKDEQKYWVTSENKPDKLYEFANKTVYRDDKFSREYNLNHPFGGNSHVVYNGNFFYNIKDTRRIIRFNLQNESTISLDLPRPDSNSKSNDNKSDKLYQGQYNTVDFNVDDNGLWLIFAVPDSNNTAVMKVNTETMKAQYIWNISLEHQRVGEMFIVCGVLYAVDSVTDRNTKIRFAFDLYKNNLLDVNLAIANPFRKTTMLGYNSKTQELYSWDRGNQLTYPVRYHDIGYNSSTAAAKDDRGELSDGGTK
uniref:Uncharacterized protein LOC114340593 n=1 Tax=Diabrotica virgifera virgifera TaxID=50390 RepID=A0A6P7GTK3_DIAVI